MQSSAISHNLDYLNNKPEIIYWKVIAPIGAKLTVLQDHDLIFDKKDKQIRQLI